MKRPLFGSNLLPARVEPTADYAIVHLCDGKVESRDWPADMVARMAEQENMIQGSGDLTATLCFKFDDCLGYSVFRMQR